MEFRQVLSKGNKHGGSCFVLYWTPALQTTRIGLTVSRKVGNAVTRNRVKRVMREYFRNVVKDWPNPREYVVIAKPKSGELQNQELRVELERVFRYSLSPIVKHRSTPRSAPTANPAGNGSPAT